MCVRVRAFREQSESLKYCVLLSFYRDLYLVQEVPDHLKHSSLHLPKHMNEFLVRLLGVKKKALCRLLPCPVVRPDIRPSALTRTGGAELLQASVVTNSKIRPNTEYRIYSGFENASNTEYQIYSVHNK